MNNLGQLNYKQLCQFLTEKNELYELKELENNTPVYGIFLAMQENYSLHVHNPEEINLTFIKTEDYLEKYLAGNLTKQEAKILTEAILNSEKNFKKLKFIIEEHAKAILDQTNEPEYKKILSNKEILIQLLRLQSRKVNFNFHFYRKKIAVGILSVASVLLILFLVPIQINKDLNELYSFDENTPLDFNHSTLRGGTFDNKIDDPEYNRFKFQFNKGMSEYLAQEYSNALSEWEVLEKDLAIYKNNRFFSDKDEQDYNLYNAVCRVALYLSKNESLNESDKIENINKALYLFEKLPLNSDIEKYYYSLALGLTDNKEKALKMLGSIDLNSDYYNKRVVLEEQLKQ